jgi:GNAT superfamily N-acetyltransferase
MTHVIRLLKPTEVRARRAALADLFVDATTSGAQINFILPMTREKADGWWDKAMAGVDAGERLVLAAEANGRVDGTVQVVFAGPENQPHRADVAKMLVHSRARRQGLGARLLRAAEEEALRAGRTLLILDTVEGREGHRLYERGGWTMFGVVPGYSLEVDGVTRTPVSFFYKEL